MNLSDEKKGIIFAVACVVVLAIIGLIFFSIANPSPEKKYGTEAVEDAEAAIFTADQYLDGRLTSSEFGRQLGVYKKELDYSGKARAIYRTILLIDLSVTDADVLKYRNELAELIGAKKR